MGAGSGVGCWIWGVGGAYLQVSITWDLLIFKWRTNAFLIDLKQEWPKMWNGLGVIVTVTLQWVFSQYQPLAKEFSRIISFSLSIRAGERQQLETYKESFPKPWSKADSLCPSFVCKVLGEAKMARWNTTSFVQHQRGLSPGLTWLLWVPWRFVCSL